MARKSFVLILMLTAFIACTIIDARADDRIITPSTGFQPAHSYSISDIEAIDNATGNLSLHIPIAQLPPGPGGFSAGLTLHYNNRYWETSPISSDYRTYYDLIHKPMAGWNLAMHPDVKFRFIQPNGEYDPCCHETYNEYFQLSLWNPDGSQTILVTRRIETVDWRQNAPWHLMTQPRNHID